MIGSEDNFTKEAAFMKEVDTFPDETTTGALLKGADHFFRRREKDLMSIIGEWIINAYPEIQGNLNLFVQTDFSTALRQQQQRLVVKPSEEVADSACGDCGLGK